MAPAPAADGGHPRLIGMQTGPPQQVSTRQSSPAWQSPCPPGHAPEPAPHEVPPGTQNPPPVAVEVQTHAGSDAQPGAKVPQLAPVHSGFGFPADPAAIAGVVKLLTIGTVQTAAMPAAAPLITVRRSGELALSFVVSSTVPLQVLGCLDLTRRPWRKDERSTIRHLREVSYVRTGATLSLIDWTASSRVVNRRS